MNEEIQKVDNTTPEGQAALKERKEASIEALKNCDGFILFTVKNQADGIACEADASAKTEHNLCVK